MVPIEKFSTAEIARIREMVPDVEKRLLGNLRRVFSYDRSPLLIPGAEYQGIWLEHNQDNIFLARYAPEAAFAWVDFFISNQRPDGLIMFAAPLELNEFYTVPYLYWHIQCVYGFALCALQIAELAGRGKADFRRIYDASVKYDRWLMKYRNTSGTGLVEMFCEWDTGFDNCPRVMDGGIPHSCPDHEAANCPDLEVLPILSVDLSAMLYGHRLGLIALAEKLGLAAEAGYWKDQAAELKKKMRELLYDPADEFYYDRSPQGPRKYRTAHITRLFLNRVLDQNEFDRVYDRYFTVPGREFLPDYPIPSVSVDDPSFDRGFPHNSWGCNTQANTMERALLWMPYYHRSDDLDGMLSRWMKSMLRPDNRFPQELNPFTGQPDPKSCNYTPALNIFLEAARRLEKYFPA